MSRVLEKPKMIDEKEVRLLLKNISKKEIMNACDLSVTDMFRICRCLDPENESEYKSKEKNYAGAKCPLTKSFPVVISQMFLNCLWWETHGANSFEYTTEQLSETMRSMKALRKQLSSLLAENKKLEKERDKVMGEKGLITQQELERHLEDQKNIHNELMDKKHIEDRNAYKTLQKRVADLKSNANYFESIVDKQKIHINYLENENADLIRQQTSATAPPPQ